MNERWRDTGQAWAADDEVPEPGPPSRRDRTARWVAVDDATGLLAEAERQGVGAPMLAHLRHHLDAEAGTLRRRGLGHLQVSGHELVFTVPTVSYTSATRSVETGTLTCLLTPVALLTLEEGDARVTRAAAERLTSDAPVPETGARRALAAVLGALVGRESDVEEGLGEAVATVERRVFSPGAAGDPSADIYDLKREIAEARRALVPLAALLPELVAQDEDEHRRGSARPWLARTQSSVDRIDHHLDAHDALLADMLTAYLSQVSVRQNEDMRKISAWAAIAAVPTLLAGIYGMNFRHMPELGWRWGYPIVIAVMLVVCGALFRSFRRSGWL